MNHETDTPRTISAMSLKQNYDLSEKDCPVYENYVHAEVCAEIERELSASKAEVERLKKELAAWDYGTRAKREQERAEKAESEIKRLKSDKVHLITQCANLLEELESRNQAFLELINERDKWRKVAESLAHKHRPQLDQRKFAKQDYWDKKLANE